MQNSECIFCKIANGNESSTHIYEDNNVVAFLDINPINPGHTLVVTKNHYESIYDTPDELLSKIAPILKKVSVAVKISTGADGINIGQNNEPAAGQVIGHLHFHVIPRFENDEHVHWKGTPYKNDAHMEKTAVTIRKNL